LVELIQGTDQTGQIGGLSMDGSVVFQIKSRCVTLIENFVHFSKITVVPYCQVGVDLPMSKILPNRYAGRLYQAIQYLDKVLALNPRHLGTLKSKAITLVELKQYQQAADYFQRVLALEPENSWNYCELGFVLAELGKHADARLRFSQAVALNPECVVAYHTKGTSLMEGGRCTEAIDYFDIGINLNPTFAPTYFHKGCACEKLGRYKEASECYGACLRLQPQHTLALQRQHECLMELNYKH
jgi:Flp pilus assembly protein TadD